MEFELLDDDAGSSDRPSGALGLTHFDFQHRVFQIPGAYISGDRDRKVLLNVKLGDVDAAMQADSLKREFDIAPDDHDSKLLGIAASSLKYVPVIVPGDAIPTEIIDGTASWPIEQKHQDMARNRMLYRLAAWVADEDAMQVTPSAMAKALSQPETKAHVKKGFADAAKALNLESSDEVLPLLEQVARELAFIEALREYYAWIAAIPRDIKVCQATLKNDRPALESTIRSHQLVMPVIRHYRGCFFDVDAQFVEVVHALGQLKQVISVIRQKRDELHRHTMYWAPIANTWRQADFNDKTQARDAISEVYALLAKHFLSGRW